MHAVATDEESGNRPCLYIQLDDGEEEGGFGGGDAGSGSEEEDSEAVQAELLPELRLVPADASERGSAALLPAALACPALHPQQVSDPPIHLVMV
jgi:hypothetical protein